MSTPPHLRRPSTRFRASFVDAVAEFRSEGLDDRTRSDQDLTAYPSWPSADGFAAYVRAITVDALDESVLPPGLVPSTRLWWTRGEQYLGRLDVRHRLTPALTEVGGHVGYAVRPSARRQGHATAMLGEALVVARALGLERVLVTCDADNVGSRRVIAANGGSLEDQRGPKLRFWIQT
ncbi:MAG TPA: GNAT family N-acetyltransferase [Friedmanniella sp.]